MLNTFVVIVYKRFKRRRVGAHVLSLFDLSRILHLMNNIYKHRHTARTVNSTVKPRERNTTTHGWCRLCCSAFILRFYFFFFYCSINGTESLSTLGLSFIPPLLPFLYIFHSLEAVNAGYQPNCSSEVYFTTCFTCMYLSIPSSPKSRPNPLLFLPPHGI